jgi:predicted acylesterase/phospholipase RssA/CheY-like chemotaxis protein
MKIDIMIVDDDPSWQKILREIFEDSGYQCDVSKNIEGAINKLEANSYRLVSMNWKIKNEAEGRKLIRYLSENFSNTPVILITGMLGGTPEEIANKSNMLSLKERYTNIKEIFLKVDPGDPNLIDRLTNMANGLIGEPYEFNKHKIPSSSKTSITVSGPKTLVLKGGGVKGLTYVGALDELTRYYHFDRFVGTSAGAIAAVLLAAGYNANELKDILFEKNFGDFLDAKPINKIINVLTQGGLYPAYEFTHWINELLAKKLESPVEVKLRDLPHRVTVYASRKNMDALIFDSEDPTTKDTPAAHAVRCSMSIPLIFIPQKRDGYRIYDGGLQNNYPIEILLKNQPDADFIGLYLGSEIYNSRNESNSVVGDMFSIWTEALDSKNLKKYNEQTIIIDPHPISTIDFDMSDDEKKFLVNVGRLGALKFLFKQGLIGKSRKSEIDSLSKVILATRDQLTKNRTKLKGLFRLIKNLVATP